MIALNTVYKFTCIIVALVMYASSEGSRVVGHLLEILLENVYMIEDITWPRRDTKFLFEC